MKTDLTSSSAINRVFAAMLLFTGSNERAEKAIIEGIASISPDGETGCEQLLLEASITAALTHDQGVRSPQQFCLGRASTLPVEMQRVLSLPRELRFSFVLRVLLAMPAEQCSRLLSLTSERIQANVRSAIETLAAGDEALPAHPFPVSTDLSLWQGEFQVA